MFQMGRFNHQLDRVLTQLTSDHYYPYHLSHQAIEGDPCQTRKTTRDRSEQRRNVLEQVREVGLWE